MNDSGGISEQTHTQIKEALAKVAPEAIQDSVKQQINEMRKNRKDEKDRIYAKIK